MIAEIHVTLKPTLLDAQGKTVQRALQQLGHRQVRDVRIGKHIQIELDDTLSSAQVEEHIEMMCRQLLANPVIEDYSILVGGETLNASTRSSANGAAATPITTSASDEVPTTRPLRSNAAATPESQPAKLDAPRLSAPQNIAASTPVTTGVAVNAAPPSSLPPNAPGATPLPRASFPDVAVANTPVGNGEEADALAAVEARPSQVTASTRGGDPFAISYESYRAMSAGERLELQGQALQKHGAWIRREMEERRAQWILCAGQNTIESGASFDDYPDENRLVTVGENSDLAPFVFTRPPV